MIQTPPVVVIGPYLASLQIQELHLQTLAWGYELLRFDHCCDLQPDIESEDNTVTPTACRSLEEGC